MSAGDETETLSLGLDDGATLQDANEVEGGLPRFPLAWTDPFFGKRGTSPVTVQEWSKGVAVAVISSSKAADCGPEFSSAVLPDHAPARWPGDVRGAALPNRAVAR